MAGPAIPRTLLIDIESSPSLGWVWQKWQTDVLSFEKDWRVLSLSWMWLEDKRPLVLGLPDFLRYKKEPDSDYDIVAKAWDLMNEAQVIIAHNISFDVKKLQARMAFWNMPPPSPFAQVDTLKMARRSFSFQSNKLGELCTHLGIGAKEDNGGMATWFGAMQGDPKAWARLKKYNAQDVRLLRDLFLKLRPWANSLPNVALMSGQTDACPKCGSQNITKQGVKYNRTTTMQQYRCNDCHGWSSSRVSDKEAPKPTLVS